MIQVKLDAATLSRLNANGGHVQICDDSGRIVGIYHSMKTEDGTEYEYWEPQLSEEEWRRRSAEPAGRKLAEILADLEKRQ